MTKDEKIELISELRSALEETNEYLENAIASADRASDLASELGGEFNRVIGGQLIYYLMGNVRAFMIDGNGAQPGNIGHLLEYLDELEDGQRLGGV